MKFFLLFVLLGLFGCSNTQRVFDKELFIACVEAAGQQDDVDEDTIYACNTASTDWVGVD